MALKCWCKREKFGGKQGVQKTESQKGLYPRRAHRCSRHPAILAALLVPTLTGYIDKANKQKIIAETRQAVMAAQTIASEQYAVYQVPTDGTKFSMTKDTEVPKSDGSGKEAYSAAIETLGELKGKVKEVTVNEKGAVTLLKLENNGKTCTHNSTSNEYTVS